MGSSNGGGTAVNSFALVSYLADPLAGFLDRLRGEFAEECHAKAHITLLPPRPLVCDAALAWQTLRQRLHDVQPFHVELGAVEIFPVTQVIYISVKTGLAELKLLHDALSCGQLAFEEPFAYHPHITLVQDLEPSQVAEAFRKTEVRWRDFPGPRSFTVDRLTFVQNTLENRWTDLYSFPLTSKVAI
ncbi:MAG TPA: 2'-5' RNA ligase family protein [Bryobacteraceae bacterium]|jgi:2'-5' RNA ligase|nr:2'-5' RNA ligase family protein [Bryobacteraceae bacterium]